MAKSKKRGAAPELRPPPPGAERWSIENAAAVLNVSVRKIIKMLDGGELTRLNATSERGRGRSVWIAAEEATAYLKGGLEGVMRWRDEQRKQAKQKGSKR
jgi:hypothetical protein